MELDPALPPLTSSLMWILPQFSSYSFNLTQIFVFICVDIQVGRSFVIVLQKQGHVLHALLDAKSVLFIQAFPCWWTLTLFSVLSHNTQCCNSILLCVHLYLYFYFCWIGSQKWKCNLNIFSTFNRVARLPFKDFYLTMYHHAVATCMTVLYFSAS